MPYQEYLNDPINRELPMGNKANENPVSTIIEGSQNLLSKGIDLFVDTAKAGPKEDALKQYSNEMNKLYQAKQQGSLSERAFRAGVAQKHIEMSNTYQGQYTDDFLKEQQNLFGYNVVGNVMQGDKSPEQQANEIAGKLKQASLEQYQKDNPGANIAANPDFYDNGVFNVDKAYGFVTQQATLDKAISEGNPNAAIQKFTADAAPYLAMLRTKTGIFSQLQGQQGSSTDSLRAQQQLGEVQQQLTNALEQRRINVLAQLPINTSPEVRKSVDESMKTVIESAKNIVPYMNENFEQTRRAMENNLGIDGLQAGHMLVTLKQAGIADDVISNIVQLKLTQNPQLQETVFKSLDDAVNAVTKKDNVTAIQTLTALRDWTKDPQKSIMSYDESTRNTMVASSLQNVKVLSAKSQLNPDETKGWYDSSLKLSGLAPLTTDPVALKNLSTWVSTPAWRDQFTKQAPTMGPEKANALADNVRALQIDALKEFNIDLRNTQFTYQEKTPAKLNPGFLTLGATPDQMNSSMTRSYEVQPYFNTATGRVEVDPRVSMNKDQQYLINTINQTLETFSSLNQYDEASVQNKLTGLAAKELVARGLLNVEVRGTSSLPKDNQEGAPVALDTYFESIRNKSASDNFLQGINQFRERVNAFATNINQDSYNLNNSNDAAAPAGGADTVGSTDNVSLLDIPTGTLTMENIKGTIAEEGLRNKVYVDSTGNRTVGIGFNMDSPGASKFWQQAGLTQKFSDVYAGRTQLSEEDAIKLFNVTKQHAIDNASKLVSNWNTIGENRQAALADMVFQLGVAGVKGFKNSLKLINEGKYQEAAANLLRSKWAQQTPARAARVAEMISSNQDRFTVNDRLVSQGKINKKSSIA